MLIDVGARFIGIRDSRCGCGGGYVGTRRWGGRAGLAVGVKARAKRDKRGRSGGII